ncbi:hypothetical protein [Halobacillus sp. H74]|uniref:hypothetical protein n=1 Tax=Halobacillus sp. H74 TaxID=3457436 RepID=UPI003FCE30B6
MDDRELQLLLKKWLKDWMNGQLQEAKVGSADRKNQSFVFLDDQTIQMLLMMLMMNKNPPSCEVHSSSNGTSREWEELMKENEKALKEIRDLLK